MKFNQLLNIKLNFKKVKFMTKYETQDGLMY